MNDVHVYVVIHFCDGNEWQPICLIYCLLIFVMFEFQLSEGKGLDLMGWFNPIKWERVGSHGLV